MIESDFDLPGLSAVAFETESPQLRFRRASTSARPAPKSRSGEKTGSEDPDCVVLNVPDVADFCIDSDGTVCVWPLSGSLGDIAAYLVGSVLGIALHLRRIVTLHASAALVGDDAVLFCGGSGSGKSTLVAALQQRGYPVISDDLCAIELTSSGAIAHSDGRKLKLWDSAIAEFNLDGKKGQPVKQGFKKFFVDVRAAPRRSASVRAIFVLSRSCLESVPRIVRVPMAERAALIRENAYRPYLVHQLKDEQLYFDVMAVLLKQSSVFRLERAHNFCQQDLVIEALEGSW